MMQPSTTYLLLTLLCLGALSQVSAARFDGRAQPQQILKSSSSGGGVHEARGVVPGNAKLRYCKEGEQEEDTVAIEYVVLEPYPPVPGRNLTITASGFVKETINLGSYVNVVAKLGWITLIKQSYDLCEQSESRLDIKCPIPRGPLQIVKEIHIPPFIPRGKITVRADAFNDGLSPITCLVGDVQFY